MSGPAKETKTNLALWIGISALLAAGAGGLALFLQSRSAQAEEELRQLKDEYGQMSDMKRKIEALKATRRAPPAAVQTMTDVIPFLDKKASESGLKYNIAQREPVKPRGWKETEYTITLTKPAKDAPISRRAVVEFLRRVEEERPSLKSKNLDFTFAGDDFSAAKITLSYFQRE